ncbi:hypothetical protein [Brevundimonas sp.]|uniref:hypothetical protein n=1 Tax=Brevundimonas sp. TaxID=1871086 RepID=UPI002D23D295|nr:hypothetical protein [Brevundimonas sp.]HYC99104.1 hypothetical protein [Brevundimonas sp.]
MDTEAQPASALSAAEDAGWELMVGERLDELANLSDVEGAQARVRPTADGIFVLLTGMQSDNDPREPTSVCAVHLFAQQRPYDAIAAAQAWVGIGPVQQQGAMARWEFALENGVVVRLDDAPPAPALFGLIAYSDQQRTQFELARAEIVE